MQGYTTIENNQVQYTESLVFAASGPLSTTLLITKLSTY